MEKPYVREYSKTLDKRIYIPKKTYMDKPAICKTLDGKTIYSKSPRWKNQILEIPKKINPILENLRCILENSN